MQWVILCLLVEADLAIKGHSIELRVYSEDPENGFLPDIGNLEIYKPPVGEGIRVDDGFEQGMDIPIYYDPMISKLATYGNTRNEAIKKMIFAIDNYHIKGVNNIGIWQICNATSRIYKWQFRYFIRRKIFPSKSNEQRRNRNCSISSSFAPRRAGK